MTSSLPQNPPPNAVYFGAYSDEPCGASRRCLPRKRDLAEPVASATPLKVDGIDPSPPPTRPARGEGGGSSGMGSSSNLIATSTFGLEGLVKRELIALGYQPEVVQPGSVAFQADWLGVCRANIRLRTAERILIRVGHFPASDFEQLFEQTRALPWHDWIPASGCFPVSGKSVQSQLSSVPACQRAVKKAIVDQLRSAHGVNQLDESGARYAVEIGILKDIATLTLDTTGQGLHKRGYRAMTGAAPLRETLAAALLMLSFWTSERPLIDPFCGTGTIPIEAALIARQIAPGLNRQFAAEQWERSDAIGWREARDEARDLVRRDFSGHIVGTDVDWRALKIARQNADVAGVADDIHFQQRSFADLTSKRQYGCVVCNPPYGHRLHDQGDVEALYASFPLVLRRLPTWSHYILTSHPQLEQILGQPADRRRKLYNGRIECQYYQFHGPRPPRPDMSEQRRTSLASKLSSDAPASPVFGGLESSATRQADEFQNRLVRRARHLRRWPKRGITCYRLYDRDIPEIPLVIDRFEEYLHVSEVARPHTRTPAEHADWLDLMVKTAAETLKIDGDKVFVKFRERQRGRSQYERIGSESRVAEVREGGLRFEINLTDYLDTGLFLDHRLTRDMIRKNADGKRVLNLFGYTGSFTVYAADGGASATTTVDQSKTYLSWARRNLELNGFDRGPHRFVCADVMDYLRDLDRDIRFDLAVVDPPTFSNRKDRSRDWLIQRDHVELLRRMHNHMAENGLIIFSTNFRRFRLLEDELPHLTFHEISKQTVPPDFRNRRVHRCWRVIV